MIRLAAAVLSLLLATPGPVAAQALLIPGHAVAREVPGAHEAPDPKLTYRIIFDVGVGADRPDAVNPGLARVARFVNTLGKAGVSADHRKVAIVFHDDATTVILNDAAWSARNGGLPNPNLALMRQLRDAGVELHVCGQGVLGAKIDPKDISPLVQLDLWAMTTIANFEARGYAHMTAGR